MQTYRAFTAISGARLYILKLPFQIYCLLHNSTIIIITNNTFLHKLMSLDLICLRKASYTYTYSYLILLGEAKY